MSRRCDPGTVIHEHCDPGMKVYQQALHFRRPCFVFAGVPATHLRSPTDCFLHRTGAGLGHPCHTKRHNLQRHNLERTKCIRCGAWIILATQDHCSMNISHKSTALQNECHTRALWHGHLTRQRSGMEASDRSFFKRMSYYQDISASQSHRKLLHLLHAGTCGHTSAALRKQATVELWP
eukprot:scaffold35418_cov20-Tisochrysis_lutea.AAC.2